VDAISLTKGCYTGQEVVARAHYRGQVKRRLQRFGTLATDELAAGQRVQLADGRSAQIVMSAPAEGGGQQFLAVTTSPSGQPDQEPATSGDTALTARLEAIPLPLPYTPSGAG
jgi:folate-binding Fe-S cluster repair protein YgfZ